MQASPGKQFYHVSHRQRAGDDPGRADPPLAREPEPEQAVQGSRCHAAAERLSSRISLFSEEALGPNCHPWGAFQAILAKLTFHSQHLEERQLYNSIACKDATIDSTTRGGPCFTPLTHPRCSAHAALFGCTVRNWCHPVYLSIIAYVYQSGAA